MSGDAESVFDLLVAGAGINGAGLARDAAGRGLKVLLVDQGDIGGATSSASTKLIHGGLRYLERFEFGLVRESLAEREILLSIAPHLAREQRFVIPHAKAARPRWMIRLGLALYDGLARGASLQRAEAVDLRGTPLGLPLRPEFARGFAYSDLATDDARLTLLNAVSAAQLGAQVRPRTRLVGARRDGKAWRAVLQAADGTQREASARILVNAAGPWTARLRKTLAGVDGPQALRLVKGSHLVLPRLHDGGQAYLLQNDDGRIVFVIPFEEDFSLVGTTELPLEAPDAAPRIDAAEADYLCGVVGRFFAAPPRPEQAVWSFAGIRALYDDGKGSATAVSREYHLALDGDAGEAPLLSIYGGKLTTYRRLAERVLDRLRPWLPGLRPSWSARVHLPGGGLGPGGLNGLLLELARRHPRLPPELLHALARRHGTLAARVLGPAQTEQDLGEHFGGGLYAAEVDYLAAHEWAQTAEDILWRRTKCGLRLDAQGRDVLARHLDTVRSSA
ncbi:MAG: glycerol-3-phosphate dehydrogenase [Burkholderiales bacterium]|nr:Aerobic glycerol-3-phosphate dehydrogenase [Rhodocyclaceae bacterium]MCZ2175382.1 glycerol-3-phosphate dehydrogenase [Burkholderiales bacterium]MCZ2421404.1 glycerol-3-phosphate dehydrogenase [Burkholderiales bacterium]